MVAAGQTTDWVEIGSWIDSLNHGQLQLVAAGEGLKYRYEFGVKNAAGQVEPIGTFDGTASRLPLAYFGDTRYRRRVIHQADVLYELLAHLKKQPWSWPAAGSCRSRSTSRWNATWSAAWASAATASWDGSSFARTGPSSPAASWERPWSWRACDD
jgi:hypothetical protein